MEEREYKEWVKCLDITMLYSYKNKYLSFYIKSDASEFGKDHVTDYLDAINFLRDNVSLTVINDLNCSDYIFDVYCENNLGFVIDVFDRTDEGTQQGLFDFIEKVQLMRRNK